MSTSDRHPDDRTTRLTLSQSAKYSDTKRKLILDKFSTGDWVFSRRGVYGRVLAVRDSEMDIDVGRQTWTLTSVADLSDLEKVDGPKSEMPGESSSVHPDMRGATVHVVLDERHGEYYGKRGHVGRRRRLVDFVCDGGGTYYEVTFPDDLEPVWIQDSCIYGHCRKYSPHPEYWLLRD